MPPSHRSDGLRKLEARADLDGVLQDEVVVLYKHSHPTWHASHRAVTEEALSRAVDPPGGPN